MINVLSHLFQGPPIMCHMLQIVKSLPVSQFSACSVLIHAATYGGINPEVMIPFVNGQELTLHEISSNDKGTCYNYCASQNGTKG